MPNHHNKSKRQQRIPRSSHNLTQTPSCSILAAAPHRSTACCCFELTVASRARTELLRLKPCLPISQKVKRKKGCACVCICVYVCLCAFPPPSAPALLVAHVHSTYRVLKGGWLMRRANFCPCPFSLHPLLVVAAVRNPIP